MSYQVIARKYRPQRFDDVVGQEHVTQTLGNAAKQNRIAHAYLFCGPRGTGKTTIARIFAKALNCTGGPKADFDENDPKCKEITEGRSLDVIEIDGASNNGVEQVRELRETCKYAPSSSKFKIYIIDEVHMLTTAAFNALLKTLEEPPAHVKFLFATTDPEKVLPTILSRCQRFDLRRIPTALIVKHLAEIAVKESVKIEEPALFAIARGAEGGMRDAESTLDQLISFCGNEIRENDVLSMFGLTAHGQLLDLSDAILAGDAERALRELNDLAKHGKDLGRLLADVLGHFRNLLLFQVSKGDLKLLEVSETEAAAIAKQAPSVTPEALTRIMDVLTDAETRLRDAASKKTLIEVTLLKAIEARKAVSIDTVLKQLQKLRSEGGGGTGESVKAPLSLAEKPVSVPAAPKVVAPVVQQTVTSVPLAPTPVAQKFSAPVMGTAVNLVQLWRDLMEAVGKASPFARSYLLQAHPVSLDKNVLTIGFDPQFSENITIVGHGKNPVVIQTKLQELGYGQCQLKFIQAPTPESWTNPVPSEPEPAFTPIPSALPSAPATTTSASEKAVEPAPVVAKPKTQSIPFNKEDFKNDPLIQKALEIFKGQIIDVRA